MTNYDMVKEICENFLKDQKQLTPQMIHLCELVIKSESYLVDILSLTTALCYAIPELQLRFNYEIFKRRMNH